ncbi:MAG: restriction endonuclease subunit S [Crocinitomicaceae bacterium]
MSTIEAHTKTKQMVPELRFPEFDGEWTKKKVKDLAKFLDSKRVPLSQSDRVNRQGEYPYYGASGIIDYVNDYLFDGEYVLLGEDGANILTRSTRLAFIASGKFWVNNHAHVLEANGSNYFLSESLERIRYEKYNTGTAQPKLNADVCKNIILEVPSLPEQQKIASFLSAVDEKIQQLSRKKELLEHYKKGVMQQIFSQQTAEEGSRTQLKNKSVGAQIRFKDENGNSYPDWEEKTLLEVAKFRRGSFPQPYGLPEWYDDENGAPFVQVYDVDDNMKLKPKTKSKISKLAEDKSVFVKKGSLVLTIQGSIGRIAKTQYDAFVDRTLLIFQDYKVDIDIDFFKYVIYLLFEIEKIKAPGGTIKTITKEELSEFPVGLPCLEEQKKIAKLFTELDEKLFSMNKSLDDTQEFKKGLLQKMFV